MRLPLPLPRSRRLSVRVVYLDLLRVLVSLVPGYFGIVVLNVLSFQLHLISVFPDGTLLAILVPSAVLAVQLSAAFAQVLQKSIETVYASEIIDARCIFNISRCGVLVAFTKAHQSFMCPGIVIENRDFDNPGP